jgi:hypothetical protein
VVSRCCCALAHHLHTCVCLAAWCGVLASAATRPLCACVAQDPAVLSGQLTLSCCTCREWTDCGDTSSKKNKKGDRRLLRA